MSTRKIKYLPSSTMHCMSHAFLEGCFPVLGMDSSARLNIMGKVCKRHMHALTAVKSHNRNKILNTYNFNRPLTPDSAYFSLLNKYDGINSLNELKTFKFSVTPSPFYTSLTSRLGTDLDSRKTSVKSISTPRLRVGANRHLSTRNILEASPHWIQPYLRLIRFDKPIGTYLLFWPCTWSIAMAAQAGHLPDFYLLALFGTGAFIMRGAGCIINDMWDKDIDIKVERTKNRPLASGELSSRQAFAFLGLNLTAALGILLQLNWFSVFVGASSMALVVTYPLAKRYTYWPQLVLGLTFNYGALLGWCAVRGHIDTAIVPLYVAGLFWTLVYDTIYAHQDKTYDLLIGVKSTALKFGDKTKAYLTVFGTGMVSCLALTGYLCDQTWPYYGAVAATAAHLIHQLYTVDLDNPDDCLRKFISNTQLGAVLFIGIVLGTLLKTDKDAKSSPSAESDV